jgi:autotransporter-associated beta strand protein
LTANLPANIIRPTAVEFINNNGVDALLVGGLSSTANAQSQITVADSDANGNLSGWRPFGSGVPNALVAQMSYNPLADVLATSAVGRGIWVLYDVTSYFPQATTLQFGLADNDSMPDASFLTNGTSANRPLIKYGIGTLTIAGNATYTGGTTINNGALVLGAGGASGSILGDVAFCSNSADFSCNASSNKVLAFDRSDAYTFGGTISGPGSVQQGGVGVTILTAQSSYTGPTNVNAGALIVNGSILSPVFVNSSGALGGTGGVGTTTVLSGGTLAPGGDGIGTLRVNGDLTLSPGSFYQAHGRNRRCDIGRYGGLFVPVWRRCAQVLNPVGVRRTERDVRFIGFDKSEKGIRPQLKILVNRRDPKCQSEPFGAHRRHFRESFVEGGRRGARRRVQLRRRLQPGRRIDQQPGHGP